MKRGMRASGIRTPGKIHRRVTYKGNGNSISRRKPLTSPMCHSDNYSVTMSAPDGCDRRKRIIFDSVAKETHSCASALVYCLIGICPLRRDSLHSSRLLLVPSSCLCFSAFVRLSFPFYFHNILINFHVSYVGFRGKMAKWGSVQLDNERREITPPLSNARGNFPVMGLSLGTK